MLKYGVTKSGNKYCAVIFAPGAKMCRIRLFKKDAKEPFSRVDMLRQNASSSVFECEFSTEQAKDCYSYDFETDSAVLTDPYAKALVGRDSFGEGRRSLDEVALVYRRQSAEALKENKDSKKNGIRARLLRKDPDFADVEHDFISYSDMILYKLHVRGFTAHESSGITARGTFKGIVQKLEHIKRLGVNALLLMPCYDFDEIIRGEFGREDKLNFWGYGAVANYFAPKASYAADPENVCSEFALFVKKAHSENIEVLMEMDFRNNTPDIMMLEVLRFWHEIYHIDGFRFISGNIPLRLFTSDPCLSGVKLINAYFDEDSVNACNIGNGLLAECKEDFSFTVRRFLRGDEGVTRDFADAIKRNSNRNAIINYLTDHNSFTLADVFSYEVRHNEANGENNQDGREINFSINCGVEGPTKDKKVIKAREQMIKNALTSLMLSQGTPLLMAGDELACSHSGNNNPYCCDNEQGYVIWEKNAFSKRICDFTAMLIAMRKAYCVFSNSMVLKGTDYVYRGCPDVSFHGMRAWYPDYGYYSKSLGVLLNGEYAVNKDNTSDSSFYLLFNMHRDEHTFDLPTVGKGSYRLLFSTDSALFYEGGKTISLQPGTAVVFKISDVAVDK